MDMTIMQFLALLQADSVRVSHDRDGWCVEAEPRCVAAVHTVTGYGDTLEDAFADAVRFYTAAEAAYEAEYTDGGE